MTLNKRGNVMGVIFFMAMLLSMIIIAPIILKVGLTILGTTSDQLAKIDLTNKSSDNVNFVAGKITGTFDWVIMVLVSINLLVLLVTAFLIDIHPAFVIVYIIAVFVAVLTIPYAAALGQEIYGMPQFSGTEGVTQYIPMTEFMLNNFGVIIVGVIILSGIIMYAKVRYGSQSGTGGSY